jgi:hypothetical protein
MEKEKRIQWLDLDIQKDRKLLAEHKKENAKALLDRNNPDHYFAQSKAAVVAGRLSRSLKEMAALVSRSPAVIAREKAREYSAISKKHQKIANLAKPRGHTIEDYRKEPAKLDYGRFTKYINSVRTRAREQNRQTKMTPMWAVAEEYRGVLLDLSGAERALKGLDLRESAKQHRTIAEMFRKAAALQKCLREEYNYTYPENVDREMYMERRYFLEDHGDAAQRHDKEAERFSNAVRWRDKHPNPFLRPKKRG